MNLNIFRNFNRPLKCCVSSYVRKISFETKSFAENYLYAKCYNISFVRISKHFFFLRNVHFGNILFKIVEVKVPQFPESVSEGDIRWEKAVNDIVKEDDVIAEVETDKTSVPIHSPSTGKIKEIIVADGNSVKSEQIVCIIETDVSDVSKPAVKKTAEVIQNKALKNKATHQVEPPKSTTDVSIKLDKIDSNIITGSRSEVRVKMNRIRIRIAERLKESQNTNAMLTTFNEIDMSFASEFRRKNLEQFLKKYGLKLGFMSTFVKASAYALMDQPVVNAVIMDNEIIYRDYIDMSIAVASPKGLVVPVLRNVEAMNYADIERGISALSEKARTNKLAVEDMDGGTFTISNGGVFGSLMGTPILNPPQSAILGMHAIIDRPVVIKGQIVIRPMMYVALTYDHRLIDGREAVMFLKKIKSAVEDPRIILAGL